MRMTVFALAATMMTTAGALADDPATGRQTGKRPLVTVETLDHAATGSIKRAGKLPGKARREGAAERTRPAGIEVNPFFPNPH